MVFLKMHIITFQKQWNNIRYSIMLSIMLEELLFNVGVVK